MSPGGGSGNLADLVVAFQLQGQQALQAALAQVQQQVGQVLSAVQGLGQQLQTHMKQAQAQTAQTAAAVNGLRASMEQASADTQMALGAIVLAVNKLGVQMAATKKPAQEAAAEVGKIQAAFEKVGGAVNVALGTAQGMILGFVRSGMAASAMGQIFQIQVERLSLTIAGLFRPEIQKITDYVARFTDWLQKLSAAQRESIARWAQAAAAALAVGVALPRVLAGAQALIGGVKALTAALSGGLASTGFGALLPLIGLAAQALTAWLVGTESGRNTLAKLSESVRRLGEDLGRLAEALHLDDVLAGVAEGMSEVVRATLEAVDAVLKLADALGLLESKQKDSSSVVKEGAKGATVAAVLPGLALWQNIKMGLVNAGLMDPDKEDPAGAKKNRSPALGRAGGFESLEATYQRIARASVGARSPEEKSALHLENIDNRLRDLDPAVRNPRPEVAR